MSQSHNDRPHTTSGRRVRAVIPILVAAALLTLTPTTGTWSASARQPANLTQAAGLALAQKLCTGCHLIGDGASAPALTGVPTFRSIANQDGQTAERIKNVLIRPHVPMPDMQLTTDEIESLMMYLDSLRSNPAVEPLLKRQPEGGKYKYPKPS